MNSTHGKSGHGVATLRWAARSLAFALLVFWGAFFVEHLAWFTRPGRLPPPWAILVQGLHGMMLVGLLAGWRWEVPGALLVLAGAVSFFWAAAGANFFLVTAFTCSPAVLLLTVHLAERRVKPGDPA
jgi:hypothetical protein